MAAKKPRILFVFAKHGTDTSTKFGGFVKRIKKNGGLAYADADYVALEDLVFEIKSNKQARVYDPVRGITLSDYAFVYFKSWQSMPSLAASAAMYLEAMGIPYADTQVRSENMVKTTNYMAMWAAGVSVPASIWGAKDTLLEHVRAMDDTSFPMIAKAVFGEKGRDNYLVKSKQEMIQIISSNDSDMVLQEFIPNDGDYRIGVYGHEARWGIYRRSGGTSHLNNTSSGGSAELLDISTVDKKIIRIAEKAAEACDLAISGVDVVQHKVTGALYIFEANQGSQIVTGAFTESNMAAFDEGIKAMMNRRYAGKSKKPRQVIGRHVAVMVEAIDEPFEVHAKVDSGAFQSSLHAENVELVNDEDGNQVVRYVIKSPSDGTLHTIETREFWRAMVRNSFGVEQERFVVPMKLRIMGVQYETRVSLADRTTQKYPLLIGRKLLRGNFLVNVELGEL